MNCKTAQHQMALAVGDDLSPNENRELQDHLQACSSCQKTWEQQQHGFTVLQRIRAHENHPKSDSVWPVLSSRLRERQSESPLREFNGWFAALAVSAACVLVFVFSQDGLVPIASTPGTGSVNGGTMISSPTELRERIPASIPPDGARTRPGYNSALPPASDRP